MKILNCVQFYEPSKGGMQEVVKRLSEGFSKAGHDVTVATSFHSDRKKMNIKVEEFKISGNIVDGINGTKEEIQRYKAFVSNGDFDIIVLYAAQQWSCDLILPILKSFKAKKIFVPTGFSGLKNDKYKNYFASMPSWLKDFDLNIFHSEVYQDHQFAKDNGVQGVVIPNGASEIEFEKLDLAKETDKLKLVHIGNHTGQKGHDELMTLYSQAKISKKSELIILGQHKLKSRCFLKCIFKSWIYNTSFRFKGSNKKIKLVSGDRAEVLKQLSTSSLFVFPSNIECSPIVLYEALASKTPFLASDVGNSVEVSRWTGGGEIFPTFFENGRSRIDISKSVSLFEKWCNDDQFRYEHAEKGYKNWKKRFTWEKIIDDYLFHFEKVQESL